MGKCGRAVKNRLTTSALDIAPGSLSTAAGQLDRKGGIVKEWSEASRDVRTPKGDAQDLYDAITEKKHGVLLWIKARW
jgi:hypothetical protein